MNYKLIKDKNGTIVDKKGERYKMSKLEYTKDDLIDLQNDYDLLYNKLDHYNKIINEQALEIARLKEENKHLNLQLDQALKDYEELQQRIDKAIEYIKEYGRDKQLEEDYLMNRYNLALYNITLLEILEGDKENE